MAADGRRRRLFGGAAAVAAAALAVVWLFVVPAQAAAAEGPAWFVIRYGHSLCWALLAVAAALFAVRGPQRAVEAFLWAGLACYAAFVLVAFVF